MRTETLLILGAGGHAKVVIDALQSGKFGGGLTVSDDNPNFIDRTCMSFPIVVPIASMLKEIGSFHVAVGSNRAREELVSRCLDAGMQPRTIMHPMAILAASAIVGAGCFIAAGAILAPNVVLGASCIINHGAVIDHDCNLGDFCHVAPNATLAGGVRLGRGVLIGAGANILPNVIIGDGCVVGAGAVVLHDIKSFSTYVGVPANPVKGINE